MHPDIIIKLTTKVFNKDHDFIWNIFRHIISVTEWSVLLEWSYLAVFKFTLTAITADSSLLPAVWFYFPLSDATVMINDNFRELIFKQALFKWSKMKDKIKRSLRGNDVLAVIKKNNFKCNPHRLIKEQILRFQLKFPHVKNEHAINGINKQPTEIRRL